MGSTGEADRKRRQFSSISPTGAAAKKHPFMPLSEDKKLDAAVLKFQNQKLVEKLEAQKIEIIDFKEKIGKLTVKQLPYENVVAVVSNSWEETVKDLESHSIHTNDCAKCERGVKDLLVRDGANPLPYNGGGSSPSDTFSSRDASPDDALLSRLLVTGATESSSTCNVTNNTEEGNHEDSKKIRNTLHTILAAVDHQWKLKDNLCSTALSAFSEDGSHRQRTSLDLQAEVKNVRMSIGNLHSKHKSLAFELQKHKDSEAKSKAELKHLRVIHLFVCLCKEELESTIAELEESNHQLAVLKAEKDAGKGPIFPILNLGNKAVAVDKSRDKEKDLQDMESALSNLLDQSSCRLLELKRLHEERIDVLKHLSTLQNTLKNIKSICSSQAYLLLKDQATKVKADIVQYQALYEKLQVEKDNLAWREKEMHLRVELLDINHRSASVADLRITELEKGIQKYINEKNLIEVKLEEALREPSRKEIIAKFKALVSSFPVEMGHMQSQLSKYKETATDIHTLRADVKSLSSILEQKAKHLGKLSARSAEQAASILKLQAVVHDLKESDKELKLILQMYRRESITSRDVLEARDSEYKAWAHVQSLKTSLDEHNLELRVKTAIEAEATSQQRLAATEAEIAELRQKQEASKREESKLSGVVKSRHEETDAYLSEIETIGQAYDDMQTQNQQLLQQITERDDYNIKLVIGGVRTRQLGDGLLMEKQAIERAIQQANTSVDFQNLKVARFEDQLKMCSDHVQRLAENRVKLTVSLENNQKKVIDIRKSAQQLRETIEDSQLKVDSNRVDLAEVQIETERERFKRKREEEDLEFARSKVSRLKSQVEGSSVVDKLRQEVREYREILKCSICLDRRKEVVIAKCYHLFCNSCVQKIIETRHRRCPVCSVSFGANDVKPVYI
ncbi:E3 ubiquitin-protein ligase BRE1-like 1 isoform X1 [Coffea arabica]|uniref:E3 ubiquitin protein ligase n=1 Tax=Coffea arabica TaxID=13443 RepID=A0A6P6WGQ4_COFAR|nr:E3 ubiquitin-protein ligase BRE1-like 1 isoform X1 [Coffea arabica]XP_027112932.1 E3 ubiquitin-protein ligase BRE1-like 1 isoform X1 [Coffea arabica]XP_027112933.1 E3 ubiquitin-protein ligase BRE1-like 1 isoform X1 [Coffea arabica]